MASLSWQLAQRYRHTKSTSAFIRFIAASSTWGVGLGVAVLILALSVMNGFEKALRDNLLNLIPHVELLAVDDPISEWQPTLALLQQTPGIRAGAPFIRSNGLLRSGAQAKGVQVRGIDLAYEQHISKLERYVVVGNLQDFGGNSIMVGKGVADSLGVTVGDELSLLLPEQQAQGQNNGFQTVTVRISALIAMGGQLDYQQVWVSLPSMAQWMSMPVDSVEGLAFAIDDIFQAHNAARALGEQMTQRVYLLDWYRSQGHLYEDIQLVRSILYLVLALVIAVASLNIVATLVMAVREKQGDIAILLTMGTQPRVLIYAFVWLGWLNGAKGALWGGVVGIAMALTISPFYQWLHQQWGLTLLDPTIYFVDYLPSELQWLDVVITVGIALAMSLLATIYPARRAAHIDPARVLGQY